MKYFKTLLQLHSLKLVLFTAFAIVYLAMATIYSSNKTEAPQSDVSITSEVANTMRAEAK